MKKKSTDELTTDFYRKLGKNPGQFVRNDDSAARKIQADEDYDQIRKDVLKGLGVI